LPDFPNMPKTFPSMLILYMRPGNASELYSTWCGGGVIQIAQGEPGILDPGGCSVLVPITGRARLGRAANAVWIPREIHPASNCIPSAIGPVRAPPCVLKSLQSSAPEQGVCPKACILPGVKNESSVG
jgi:hypothetical protein